MQDELLSPTSAPLLSHIGDTDASHRDSLLLVEEHCDDGEQFGQ